MSSKSRSQTGDITTFGQLAAVDSIQKRCAKEGLPVPLRGIHLEVIEQMWRFGDNAELVIKDPFVYIRDQKAKQDVKSSLSLSTKLEHAITHLEALGVLRRRAANMKVWYWTGRQTLGPSTILISAPAKSGPSSWYLWPQEQEAATQAINNSSTRATRERGALALEKLIGKTSGLQLDTLESVEEADDPVPPLAPVVTRDGVDDVNAVMEALMQVKDNGLRNRAMFALGRIAGAMEVRR